MACRIEPERKQSQSKKRSQDPAGIDEPELANSSWLVLRIADKPEDLERNHRQHTGHHVQDQAPEESVEKHLDNRSALSDNRAVGCYAGCRVIRVHNGNVYLIRRLSGALPVNDQP